MISQESIQNIHNKKKLVKYWQQSVVSLANSETTKRVGCITRESCYPYFSAFSKCKYFLIVMINSINKYIINSYYSTESWRLLLFIYLLVFLGFFSKLMISLNFYIAPASRRRNLEEILWKWKVDSENEDLYTLNMTVLSCSVLPFSQNQL